MNMNGSNNQKAADQTLPAIITIGGMPKEENRPFDLVRLKLMEVAGDMIHLLMPITCITFRISNLTLTGKIQN